MTLLKRQIMVMAISLPMMKAKRLTESDLPPALGTSSSLETVNQWSKNEGFRNKHRKTVTGGLILSGAAIFFLIIYASSDRNIHEEKIKAKWSMIIDQLLTANATANPFCSHLKHHRRIYVYFLIIHLYHHIYLYWDSHLSNSSHESGFRH